MLSKMLRPRLHENVFIENNIVFNETTTIVLHLHIIFVSFYNKINRLHGNGEND